MLSGKISGSGRQTSTMTSRMGSRICIWSFRIRDEDLSGIVSESEGSGPDSIMRWCYIYVEGNIEIERRKECAKEVEIIAILLHKPIIQVS